MRATDAHKVLELVHAVADMDNVNPGVAKARLAGEANFSVPLLERLMRGESVSPAAQVRLLGACQARALSFTMDDLFPPVSAGSGEAS